MTKDKIKYLLKSFWENNFNKALLIDAVIITIVSFIWTWTTPISMIVWMIVLYRAKDIRNLSPNRSLLLFFLMFSNILATYWIYFSISNIVLLLFMFLPERVWGFLKK